MKDGWGNPIIFVPASIGLAGSSTQGVKLGTSTYVAITSPDGRPFWASAGPDGDFATGDDNVYSFEQ
jgi:hypothetical protein